MTGTFTAMTFQEVAEWAGKALDAAGIVVIVAGALVATVAFASALRATVFADAYRSYRQGLGRAILLGLEFLVGADIIRTVAVDPTFGSVGVLAVIVAVRTFLSMTIELEISGRWPWQPPRPTPEEFQPEP